MYGLVKESLRTRPRSWLVTGAAGFIGSNLVEALLKLGQRVTGLDNLSAGSMDNLREVQDAVGAGSWRRFRFIEGDICSLPTCREACRSVNLVLHQAALGSVPLSLENPIGTNASNVAGFLNVLVAARDAGVKRVVYAGSSASYGDNPAPLMLETQTGRLLSPYALSKYVDELYADVFARCYRLETVGLRYFNVFGRRQDPEGAYASVVSGWIASMIREQPVYINGDGETTRDFCYVDNVVQANLLAAMVDDHAAVNQVYNIALGGKTTLNELFVMLRSLLVPRFAHLRDLRPLHREFRAGDVRYSQADIGKARQMLGYQPVWDVKSGLEEAIDWYVARLAPQRETGPGRIATAVQAAAP